MPSKLKNKNLDFSIIVTLEKYIVGKTSAQNKIIEIAKPVIDKYVSRNVNQSVNQREIKDWILSWISVHKKFEYIYSKLKENEESNENYSFENQLNDFKALLYKITQSGFLEYFKEKKTKISTISINTPLGDEKKDKDVKTLEDTLEDKSQPDISEIVDKPFERHKFDNLMNKVPINLKVPFKLFTLTEFLDSEDYKWIKKQSKLSKKEIKIKIIENYDASTKIHPLSAKFIAELLNISVDNVNQRVRRTRNLLKSFSKIQDLKKDYEIK